MRVHVIDNQVVEILRQLKPPADWRSKITQTMSEILGEQNLEQRLAEIRATIERMDFRWDNGFITDKQDYLEKRLKLQQELEQLTPVQDERDTAADLLENFRSYWDACEEDVERQHELVKLIVDRVYVEDDRVVALTPKADYHVVLGHKVNEPTYNLHGDGPVYTPVGAKDIIHVICGVARFANGRVCAKVKVYARN